MGPFLAWLEATSLSIWLREATTVWAFPAVLSCHTVGMGLVAGISTAIDLRILGFAPGIPLMETKRFVPFLWFGFWLNAISGVFLLITYPTKAVTNPVFYLKLGFIALALVFFRKIQKRVYADPNLDQNPVPRRGRNLAIASLVCWAGAIIAGRLLAYTYRHLLMGE
jgi:mannose/fructose/N-acetylgalactosamine-specific phosphotransferase system component IIC